MTFPWPNDKIPWPKQAARAWISCSLAAPVYKMLVNFHDSSMTFCSCFKIPRLFHFSLNSMTFPEIPWLFHHCVNPVNSQQSGQPSVKLLLRGCKRSEYYLTCNTRPSDVHFTYEQVQNKFRLERSNRRPKEAPLSVALPACVNHGFTYSIKTEVMFKRNSQVLTWVCRGEMLFTQKR